jgi:hypothetical protein
MFITLAWPRHITERNGCFDLYTSFISSLIIEVIVPRQESKRLYICAQCFLDLILEFFQQCGIVVDFINRNCSKQNIYVIFYLKNQYIYRLLHAIFHIIFISPRSWYMNEGWKRVWYEKWHVMICLSNTLTEEITELYQNV